MTDISVNIDIRIWKNMRLSHIAVTGETKKNFKPMVAPSQGIWKCEMETEKEITKLYEIWSLRELLAAYPHIKT